MKKIGIISRNYNKTRDFSRHFEEVLGLLDKEYCDTALFSLYSIDVKDSPFDPLKILEKLKNVKIVIYEEFLDKKDRTPLQVVIYKKEQNWSRVEYKQSFSKRAGISTKVLRDFVAHKLPNRYIENGCLLICGEINGVKYQKNDRYIVDDFGMVKSMPKSVDVVLNPLHDKMIRHEMRKKRRYISKDRILLSVWNRGKLDKRGKESFDGSSPPFEIFKDGNNLYIKIAKKIEDVTVAIVDTGVRR